MGLALALPSRAQDLPQDYVNAHNAARAQVGVNPVKCDESIAAFARSYANRRYGENLAGSSGNLSGSDAVGLWVSEKADYDYNSNSCNAGKVCGHYTHVVWRNSVRIGCAKVRCNNGGTFVGCNYASPGDVVGQKPY
ncbi:hypothetical protein CUMW_209460 [Citrus unshiu]|uniref:SCP domain-containing protein n=2 Tax=Citrus TaxID=2706 RepID=A0A067DPL9_CITSI|nr:hypothetical protein CISIN_1g045858mg [Citrus sinensis]GAY61370.1 hypothetical protein CUMW_209460 [Citrus unshiu]